MKSGGKEKWQNQKCVKAEARREAKRKEKEENG